MASPLSSVVISPSVGESMVAHALLTEKEEVLGLCVGSYSKASGSSTESTVYISDIFLLRRRHKAADRVEVSDKDLSEASHFAESLGLSVVGWYHSHPHITIHPSHVDLATQQLYQRLDSRFVGIIVAAFDKSRGKIGMAAFQAGPQLQEVTVPIQFTGEQQETVQVYRKMVDLVRILAAEERAAYSAAVGLPDADSSATPASRQDFHPLISISAAATYQRSLARLLEMQVSPLVSALEEQLHRANKRLDQLQAK